MKQITTEELQQLVESCQDINIIDVRPQELYAQGHVPGAVNIPLADLEDNLDQLDKDQAYYLICQMGVTSQKACQFLDDKGYQVIDVAKGTPAYPGDLAQ